MALPDLRLAARDRPAARGERDRSPTGRADGLWRYRGWLPGADPVELGEPRTALVELPADGNPGGRDPREARGRTADRLVQGPRDGGDRVVAPVPGRARARRRFVGQRGCVVRRLRRPCRTAAARLRPGGCFARQAAPDAGVRRDAGGRAGIPIRRLARRPGRPWRGPDPRSPMPRTSGRPRSSPARRRSPTSCSSSLATGRPMRSSRRSAAARCCSGSTSGSVACAPPA